MHFGVSPIIQTVKVRELSSKSSCKSQIKLNFYVSSVRGVAFNNFSFRQSNDPHLQYVIAKLRCWFDPVASPCRALRRLPLVTLLSLGVHTIFCDQRKKPWLALQCLKFIIVELFVNWLWVKRETIDLGVDKPGFGRQLMGDCFGSANP